MRNPVPIGTGTAPDDLRAYIAEGLERARRRTHALTACDEEELLKQHSPLMSPLVWDLAHVGSQEEQWLVRDVGGMEPLRPEIDKLYDAFEHSRSSRPSLPLLAPGESRGYLAQVRSKTLDILDRVPLEGSPLLEAGFAFGMMVQHEQQHAETMLATHQLRVGEPVLHPVAPDPRVLSRRVTGLPPEVLIPGGSFSMGTSVEPWALDNERPAHEVHVPGYWIDTVPVSNGSFLEFINDGGYANPDWWTAEGWSSRNDDDLTAPKYWMRDGHQWWRVRFGVV
ncbi:SUMF1/EgtB/PvdO family nonheme iron enzyme, partial [Arthrobacter sp. H41]|uniref:SUMF1/EgtB/PvdO family nonheme iron enzyme n=1 Tax=Arthrobacter sp. H41 TaxID=1312978 RepID=UPI0012DBD00C